MNSEHSLSGFDVAIERMNSMEYPTFHSQVIDADWTCTHCNIHNPVHALKCLACDRDKLLDNVHIQKTQFKHKSAFAFFVRANINKLVCEKKDMKSKLKEMWDKASSVERSYYELQEKEALRLAGIDTQNSHGEEITHNYNNSDINTIGVKRHSEENNDIVCRNDDQKRRKFYSSFAFFVREYLPVVEKELGRDVEREVKKSRLLQMWETLGVHERRKFEDMEKASFKQYLKHACDM